ncbi:MAG: hypothetical protein QOF65_2909 [Thermoleophilaceae bacterium]|jgi:DNA invertase Pin-like site-specific DNA recombinase|nr:hypothetical protein [Thermoleophilaceae bacterium]
MSALLIGYARVSTDQQDLTAQRDGLAALGVGEDRLYVDHGLTGANRDRPGLRQALAACRAGDTLVVTKLDRLARTKEGMRVARAKGRLRGKQPKLNPRQEAHLVMLYRAGEHTVSELEDLFGITRSTVYRAVQRDTRRLPSGTSPREMTIVRS